MIEQRIVHGLDPVGIRTAKGSFECGEALRQAVDVADLGAALEARHDQRHKRAEDRTRDGARRDGKPQRLAGCGGMNRRLRLDGGSVGVSGGRIPRPVGLWIGYGL